MNEVQLQDLWEGNGKWKEVGEPQPVWEALKSQVDPIDGIVVGRDSTWGERTYQIRMNKRDGGVACVNLSKLTSLKEGDKVNLESMVMVTLTRGVGQKQETKYRYDAKKLVPEDENEDE